MLPFAIATFFLLVVTNDYGTYCRGTTAEYERYYFANTITGGPDSPIGSKESHTVKDGWLQQKHLGARVDGGTPWSSTVPSTTLDHLKHSQKHLSTPQELYKTPLPFTTADCMKDSFHFLYHRMRNMEAKYSLLQDIIL